MMPLLVTAALPLPCAALPCGLIWPAACHDLDDLLRLVGASWILAAFGLGVLR